MNLAVIPARGGSKRIPKKNIKKFNNIPVIYYSIKAAQESNIFDKIIVSTDDKKIAQIANHYGAETPFVRPKIISGDYTPSNEVVKNAIKFYENQKLKFKNICCIYPVAPFISPKDIRRAYKILVNKKWDFVFTSVKSPFKIERSFYKKKDDSLQMNFPNSYSKRSQDIRDYFYDAGQFYWGKKKSWLKHKKLFNRYSTILELPFWRAIDIDNLSDWKNAEFINRNLREKI